MNFEQWWATYWKNTFSVPVMNEAMKEIAKAAWEAAKNAEAILDKNGREIHAGDKLHNPYDVNEYYLVFGNPDGKLFLGDLDSPLESYAPHLWWEIVDQDKSDEL